MRFVACLGFVLLLSCLGLKQSLNVGSCFVLDFERLNYGIFFFMLENFLKIDSHVCR